LEGKKGRKAKKEKKTGKLDGAAETKEGK